MRQEVAVKGTDSFVAPSFSLSQSLLLEKCCVDVAILSVAGPVQCRSKLDKV